MEDLFKRVEDPVFFISVSIFSVLTLALLLRRLSVKRHNLPPGPYGVPFLGYAPFLGSYPHIVYNKLSKKYGNVFRFNLAGTTTIVLGDYKHIKEAFSKPAFLGTGFERALDVMPSGGGFLGISGKPWQEQRKFAVKVFNDITFGKDNISELFKEEIIDFIRYLESLNGKPIDFFNEVLVSLMNVSLQMVSLCRFDYKSSTTDMLKETINAFVAFFKGADFFLLPFIKKVKAMFIRDREYQRISDTFQKYDRFFKDIIEEHKRHLDKGHPRDFIDHYLIKHEEERGNKETSFTERMLVGNVTLFFLAGSVDTRSALCWTILIMAAFPDVQRRLQEEIDEVLGRERFPVWADRNDLPFVEATLRECHRWKTTSPTACTRTTVEDTDIGGYFIPKGALVIPNIWAVHNDPMYWKDPEKFRPERHLSSDGKSLINHDQYIPFSYGRRQCPGEKFANMESFMYLVAILQRFNIRMPPGKQADMTEIVAVNVHPKPQDICFIPRQ